MKERAPSERPQTQVSTVLMMLSICIYHVSVWGEEKNILHYPPVIRAAHSCDLSCLFIDFRIVQASSSCSFSSAKLCWQRMREFATNKTFCVLLVSIQWITCKRANVTVGRKTWYCISICVKCANDSYPPFTSCHACPSLFSVSTCWKKLLTRGKYLLYLVLTYFDGTCFLLNQSDHVKAVCFFR